jgi:hypothetical protein
MTTVLDYFAAPGRMTGAGDYAELLDPLTTDIASLCGVVQGLMIHIHWADEYGIRLPEERKDEVQLRSVLSKLERIRKLDARPLTEARSLDKRLVGNCRDFSVMLTAILRHQGVPARARCGFGRYFIPNHYEDHWVCEYWNAIQHRWVLADAQLDEFQRNRLSIQFNPLDVPRTQFVVGGEAWQMCRNGEADPERFGIFEMHGLWFVRGNFIRDVASLNKVELLPWDGWGIIEARDEELSVEDLAFLDRVAELTRGDVPEFDKVHKLYENDNRFHVPATIHSYTQGGVETIDLEDI